MSYIMCGCGQKWNQWCASAALANQTGNPCYTCDMSAIPSCVKRDPQKLREYVTNKNNLYPEKNHYMVKQNNAPKGKDEI